MDKDGEWLHELALNNSVLETLNFYMTELAKVRFEDLELIAKNCRSLISMKISDCEVLDLVGFFRAATALEEFAGGSFGEQSDNTSAVSFPPRLCSLGLNYMGKNEMPIVFPFASLLKKLDLLYCFLDTEDHCLLIQKCPNLEFLEVESITVSYFFIMLFVCVCMFFFLLGGIILCVLGFTLFIKCHDRIQQCHLVYFVSTLPYIVVVFIQFKKSKSMIIIF